MNAAQRLTAYGAGLVVAFAGAYGIAGAVVPDSLVAGWQEEGSADAAHSGTHAATTPAVTSEPKSVKGVSLSADGYSLAAVTAPRAANTAGRIGFTVLDKAGEPLRGFEVAHEKQLHLIVVRSDGAGYQHLHPTLDAGTGRWTAPVTWPEAGTYRIYTDFTPQGAASSLTLTQTVEVDGARTARAPEITRVATVDGYTATLRGDLAAGGSSDLTVAIARNGEPVTGLQPYLGAYGHLVALREGDLAYLHVHAKGDAPQPGSTSGPDIAFGAEAPTAGRYLLYLDFQVDGVVRTAQFVVEATRGGASAPAHDAGH